MPLFKKKPQKKPVAPARPVEPVKPKRTEAELRAEAAKWAARIAQSSNNSAGQSAAKQPQQSGQARRPATKEDMLREMTQNDPEKAAAIIRETFLKNKK